MTGTPRTWVTVREAAAIASVSHRRILQLVREDAIPAQRAGRVWLVHRAGLAGRARSPRHQAAGRERARRHSDMAGA